MRCAICGCKYHRVKGTLRHYGSFAACDRLAEAIKLLLDIADDASDDGPINRGLNSVQAVLAWAKPHEPYRHAVDERISRSLPRAAVTAKVGREEGA